MTAAIASRARILTDKTVSKHGCDSRNITLHPDPSVPAWQTALQAGVTEPAELLDRLGLGREWLPGAERAARLFPLRVPESYVMRMHHGDPHDPLLRQVLPLDAECEQTRGFSDDAVGDLASSRGNGLLQKYHGRALLITTGACAVNCRFCFRRSFPYNEQLAARNNWQESLDILASDTGIREVILSGGDPLSLPDRKLAELAGRLDSITHLERLRIHTRQPIVLPERVDNELLSWLSHGRLQRIVVLHTNHARELDRQTGHAIQRLAETGTVLLNQTVLLKGVNDSAAALADLSNALFRYGVLPYYLHLLDRVQGTAHFEVSESKAGILMREVAAVLPGYLVPRLVREEAGRANKTVVM